MEALEHCDNTFYRQWVIGSVLFAFMPGAFFWKNKGFEEHAQSLGMHHNVNTGVPPLRH